MAKLKNKRTWRAKKTALANAQAVLPNRAEKFFRDGREAAATAGDPKALHKFRLKVKKFRYTLELFRPCYGPGLEKRLKSLKKLQDYLGALSDFDTTAGLLNGSHLSELEECSTLEEHLRNQVDVNTKKFLCYWNEEFDADGEERKWVDYLKRDPRRNQKPVQSATSNKVRQAESA